MMAHAPRSLAHMNAKRSTWALSHAWQYCSLVLSQQQCRVSPRLLHSAATNQASTKQELSWQELHRAAQIAAWSGLCYHLPQDLQAAIDQQHQGLTLVASGRNEYTAWFVADGEVPAANFCTTISNRSRSSNGSSSSNTSAADNQASSSTVTASAASAASASDVGVCQQVAQGTRERFVFMRGVQWSAPDINSTKLSQALLALWPTPFPPGANSSSSSSANSSRASSPNQANGGNRGAADAANSSGNWPLVAHPGVAGIAQGLFDQLRPYLDQADDVGMPLCFAGHSLGGSLAMLTLVLHQFHRRPGKPVPTPSCYTFGSPPVLAHEQGGGGHLVLGALGLNPDSIKGFVLEMDPVPRALLSVDPAFEMLRSWSAVKGLLQLRELLVGQGSPLSPNRFLFEAVGQVYLIKWTPEGGAQVVPLDAAEIEQELSFLAPKAASSSSSSSTSRGTSSSTRSSSPSSQQVVQQEGQSQQQGAADVAPVGEPSPAIAAGGAAGALMNSLRGWLDHHHRSYAQELEAAALRSVRQELAAEQQQAHHQQQQPA